MSINSTNIQNEVNKSNIVAEMGTSLAFSGLMTGGFGSLSALKRNSFNPVKAVRQTKLNNQVVNEFLKKNVSNCDSFSRSYIASKSYEEYASIQKSAQKASKKVNKLLKRNNKPTIFQRATSLKKHEKGTPLTERFKHFFKSGDEIAQDITAKSEKAAKQLSEVQNNLKNGVDITAKKVASKTIKQNTRLLFKEELLNPLNVAFVAVSALGRIKDEAMPAFKNEGFVAGVKKLVTVGAKTVADTVSNAGFSVAFRMIGSRIGMIAGPAGAAVGGLVGDIAGSFLSCKLITKVFGEDKKPETSPDNQTLAQNQPEQNIQEQNDATPIQSGEISQAVDTAQIQPQVQTKTRKYTPEQQAAALARIEAREKQKMQGYLA